LEKVAHMRICLIIDDYLPDSIKVGAKMMHELACEFKNQGHEITVITPSPKITEDTQITKLDGIKIYRFKSGEIKNVSKIKRAINETLLSYYAWKNFKNHLKANPHDLIVYYSPSIFWGSLVSRLKILWSAPSYLILRDIFPQWIIDQGIIKKGSIIEKYFRFFEMKNYKAADTIGLMSANNLDWFKTNIHINIPSEILYNWANNKPVDAKSNYKERLGLSKKTIYFYGGNIGHAQDMMNIIRLAINVQNNTNIHFVLVGAGDEVNLIKNSIFKEKLNNITLLPPVSQDEFKQMLAEFDVGLFTLHKDHKTHNFPGKLLGYMVQRLPILGCVNPGNDLKEIIEEAGAGFITITGDDEKLLENALTLQDKNKRKEVGEKANMLLQNLFSVQAAADKILNSGGYRNHF